jgi:hypothetical protein
LAINSLAAICYLQLTRRRDLAGQKGTGGSNPHLSPHSLDRRETPPSCSKNRKKSPKFRDSHPQTGLEKATRQTAYGNFGEFFCGQQKRSPVSTRTFGRMQCDHKSTMRPRRLDSTHGKTSHFLTKARRRKDLDSIEARRKCRIECNSSLYTSEYRSLYSFLFGLR